MIKQYNFSICNIELCVGRIDLCIGRINFSNSGESTYFWAIQLIFIQANRLSGDSTCIHIYIYIIRTQFLLDLMYQ